MEGSLIIDVPYLTLTEKVINGRLIPHKESVKVLRWKLKAKTIQKYSAPMIVRIIELNSIIRGWVNYYAICDMKTYMAGIDAHLRTIKNYHLETMEKTK